MNHCSLIAGLFVCCFSVAEICAQNFIYRTQRCEKPFLENGKVKLLNSGRNAKFRCNRSFEIVGQKYGTCLRSKWNSIPVCVRPGCPTFASVKNGQKLETYSGAVMTFICDPGYKIVGSQQIHCDGTFWNGTFPKCEANEHMSQPWCDFETEEICGWTHDPSNNWNWRRQNYQMQVGGPSFDHTLGPSRNGYFMFIEVPRAANGSARIFSPVYSAHLTSSQPACFMFWFHMNVNNSGILNVYIKPEDNSSLLRFSRTGNLGNTWLKGVIKLPNMNQNFQIVIEAVLGPQYNGFIAIDDVIITNGSECNTTVTSNEPEVMKTQEGTTMTTPRLSIRTFPPPPPLPPLPPIPTFETVSEASVSIANKTTTALSTATSQRSTVNVSTTIHTIIYNPRPYAGSVLTQATEEPKERIPIPTEPTPLILKPPTQIVFRKTVSPSTTTKTSTISTTAATKKTTFPTKSTAASTAVRTTTTTTTTTTPPTSKSTTTKTTTTTQPVTTKSTIFVPFIKIINTTTTATTPYRMRFPRRTYVITRPTTSISTRPTTAATTAATTKTTTETTEITTTVTNVFERTTRDKKWVQARSGPRKAYRTKGTPISAIVGTVTAVLLIIVATGIAVIFFLRRRRHKHQQSSIADDSDVRFLTADEALDFSLARPMDSGDDDL